MLLQASNTLILDEPTNHLDMRTKDIVKEALLQFGGTFVIVSHDRYFLNGLVTKVIELHDGHFTTYTGTFEDFLDWKERQKTRPTQPAQTQPASQAAPTRAALSSPAPNTDGIAGALAAIHQAKHGKLSYQEQKAVRAERQKRAKRLAALEKNIAALEAKKDQLEALLADEKTFQHQDTARDVSAQYEQLKRQLDEAYLAWTALAEEHEHEHE